jgi:hypothetical protein
MTHGVRGSPLGRRYVPPPAVNAALGQIFDESVGEVKIIERSLYARAHWGMSATTRPNCILLAISGAAFIAEPELVLHEYFHVLRQWSTGNLTRREYLSESMRRGYWENRFEVEARQFAADELARYLRYLRQPATSCAAPRPLASRRLRSRS